MKTRGTFICEQDIRRSISRTRDGHVRYVDFRTYGTLVTIFFNLVKIYSCCASRV